MVFLNTIIFFSLYIVWKYFWYNFALEDIYCIKLEWNCLRIGRNISESWKKNDKIDKSCFKLFVIKNLAIKNWYLWVEKANKC